MPFGKGSFCAALAMALSHLTPLGAAAPSEGAGASFSFTLDAECDTSAGVYASRSGQDVLVRTLWRSVHYAKGTHEAQWDGIDDEGHQTNAGAYKITVLCGNISYVWDGVIGNSSPTFTGVVFQAGTGYGVTDLSPSDDGATMYAAFGYNEGTYDIRAFSATDPQGPRNCVPHSTHTAYALLAVDGARMYAANIGDVDPDPERTTFIRALNLRDFTAVADYGQTVSYGSDGPRIGACLDVQQGAGRSVDPDDPVHYWAAATGLAIQRGAGGHILAVSHGNSLQRKASDTSTTTLVSGLDKILLFDKGTAESLGAITAFNPQKIAFARNGDLWAIVALTKNGVPNAVVRFAADSLGKTNIPATTITDVSRPMAVTTSTDHSILVADAGANETVRAYDAAGRYLAESSYGEQGGYKTNGPEVNDRRFQFAEEIGEKAPLSALPDGSFWVGDGGPGRGGTGRLLHISAKRTSLPGISFLTTNSTVACDPNDPTRVFWDYLEYKVDYSKPLLPGAHGGWKLVKNWAAGLKSSFYPYRGSGIGLNTVVTLTKDGTTATYGFIHDPKSNSPPTNSVVELPAKGPLRFTGQHMDQGYRPALNYSLSPSGDLRYATWEAETGIQEIFKLPLAAIDGARNPKWASPVKLATTSLHKGDLSTGSGYWGTSTIQFPVTGNGVVTTFDSSEGPRSARGMRLGGSAVNGSGYLWKAIPKLDADVPFDGLGSFDIGDGVTAYGGDIVMGIEPLDPADTSQHHLIYGFPGEFWNQTEANQFMHFYDNGLFVGQFGTPGRVQNEIGPAIAGYAGNSFCPALVQNPGDGEIYLYHNDESNHAGIHRWHVVGANALFCYSGNVVTGSSAPSVTLAASPPAAPPNTPPAPVGLRVTSTDRNLVMLRWNAVAGAGTYQVKVADRRGGPYTATKASTSTAKLASDVLSYVCVSAVSSANVESRNSDEIKVLPLDGSPNVQKAGSLMYRRWEPDALTATAKAGFKVESQAAAKGGFALKIPKTLDTLGALLRTDVGSEGCVIYGSGGATPNLSNLAGGLSVELDPSSTWTPQNHLKNSFSIDGQMGSQSGLHAENDGASRVHINVVDAGRWHTLTVFAPDIFEDNQWCAISLAPAGQTTPGASYEIRDMDSADGLAQGFNRVLQFRFRGNVTLTFQQPAGTTHALDSGHSPRNGNLQALFFDDAPELASP